VILIPSDDCTAGIHCETSGKTNELPAPVRLPPLADELPLVCAAAVPTRASAAPSDAIDPRMTVLLFKISLLL
jgi:hypothetical protein